MRRGTLPVLVLVTAVAAPACILRPGMNTDCEWPPEPSRAIDPADSAGQRHLVVDAELIEELVDRYRFHPPDGQRQCEVHLSAIVARLHSVELAEVERARQRIPQRGLDLPVTVPVAALFFFIVPRIIRRIKRRFGDEPVPATISLILASIAVSGLFVMAGEFWTSILQMIRVGSFHVGGRVDRLPWTQHEPQILVIGIALFWVVVVLERAGARRDRNGGAVDEPPRLLD
jgi:hypothetical protein